jgi:hypothetical protein
MWYSYQEKHLFLVMSSTNIDTLVQSLYQCVETRSIEVFWSLFQSLPQLVEHHLRLSNVRERIFRPSCEPLCATKTSHSKQETVLYEYPLHWVILPTEIRTTERCSSAIYSSSTVAILTTETILWVCACSSAICLSWTWTVLPPSYTDRKPVYSLFLVLWRIILKWT